MPCHTHIHCIHNVLCTSVMMLICSVYVCSCSESNVAHEPTLQKGWEVLQQSHLELNEWRSKFTQLSKQQMKLSKVIV